MVLRGRSFIAAAAVCLLTGIVAGQEASAHERNDNLQQRLVGTWTYTGAKAAASEGEPRRADEPTTGILVLTGHGRFAQILVVPASSSVGSTSRVRAGAKASVALFGTYTVDDATRTLSYRVQSSTIPQWNGIEQQLSIDTLTANELQLRSLAGSMHPSTAATMWKRADAAAVLATP